MAGTVTHEKDVAAPPSSPEQASEGRIQVTLTEKMKNPKGPRKQTQKRSNNKRKEPIKGQPSISKLFGTKVTPVMTNGAKGPKEDLKTNCNSKNKLKVVDMVDKERESEEHRTRGGNMRQTTLGELQLKLTHKINQNPGRGPEDKTENSPDQEEPRVVKYLANHRLEKAS